MKNLRITKKRIIRDYWKIISAHDNYFKSIIHIMVRNWVLSENNKLIDTR